MPDKNYSEVGSLLGPVIPEGPVHDRKERHRDSATVTVGEALTHILSSQLGDHEAQGV